MIQSRGIYHNCSTSGCRFFLKSGKALAQLSPAVVRQKRDLDRLRSVNVQNSKNYDSEESLPPINLLRIAHKSGALTLEPEKAVEFLRRYHELAPKTSTSYEQKLCREFGIEPRSVSLLAVILKRCKAKAQQLLARKLLLSASVMGDKSATFEILSAALRSNLTHHYQATLAQLNELAKSGDQQAMMLLGKVLFYNQSEKNSLSWLKRATEPPSGSLEFNGAGEALVLKGRILQKLGDSSVARAQFEKAAEELDDPEAYFYLSKMEKNGSSIQQVYLTKAAIAGITEAWYSLGVIELQKIQRKGLQITILEDYGMAREWFLVAANDGNGPSMINLAIMCKMTRHFSQALQWLDKAEIIPKTSAEAKRLRQEWSKISQCV